MNPTNPTKNPTKAEIGNRAIEAAAAIAKALGHTWSEYAAEWLDDMGIEEFREYVINRYYTDRGVSRERPGLFVGSLGCGIPAPTVHWEGGRWVISHRSWTGRIYYRLWQAQAGGVQNGGYLNALIEISRPQGLAIQVRMEPTGDTLWVSKETDTRKRHWAAALKVARPLREFFPAADEVIKQLERGLEQAPQDYVDDDA